MRSRFNKETCGGGRAPYVVALLVLYVFLLIRGPLIGGGGLATRTVRGVPQEWTGGVKNRFSQFIRQPTMAAAGRLANMTAVVTGAATGIGRSVAHRFALEGAKVIVADMDHMAGAEAVRYIKQTGPGAVEVQFAGGDAI
jgi:hypothetical protein